MSCSVPEPTSRPSSSVPASRPQLASSAAATAASMSAHTSTKTSSATAATASSSSDAPKWFKRGKFCWICSLTCRYRAIISIQLLGVLLDELLKVENGDLTKAFGKRCKLPQRGLRWSPSQKWFYGIWWPENTSGEMNESYFIQWLQSFIH